MTKFSRKPVVFVAILLAFATVALFQNCAGTAFLPSNSNILSASIPNGPFYYGWQQIWGSCSAACGGGVRSSVVNCVRSDFVVVDDSNCAASGAKPALTQNCQTQACQSFQWVQGGFGACSAVCSGGSQSQAVLCESATGSVVANSNCNIANIPSSVQSCNSQVCGSTPTPSPTPSPILPPASADPYWITGVYGSCSASCGGGTQTRSVTCKDISGIVLPDSYCTGSKPTVSAACNPQSCAPAGTSGSWQVDNNATSDEMINAVACSGQGFARTDITNGYHTPTSCGDVGLVCDLFETMGFNINNAWPHFMKCQPTAGQMGQWKVKDAITTADLALLHGCSSDNIVRTGLAANAYSVPASCGDVGSICDLFDVMGVNINGAWPHYLQCQSAPVDIGTWAEYPVATPQESLNIIVSCSDMGFSRTGIGANFHTPTSCPSKGQVCDLFNVMGYNINGAWPHYMKCQ